MRVIAGNLGGRSFDSPNSVKTHPMGDKIRGALFNILGDIEGLSVLDAFAGSGALGFEAISRGAQSVVAIDSDRAAQRVIAGNSRLLQVDDRLTLIKASASAWLQTNPDTVFDLVLCDPPYTDLQLPLLQRLAACLTPEGVLVVSWPISTDVPEFAGLKKVAHRSYGDAQLLFFSKTI
jgi:16S rRNA (guanine966-N2)-methyltransferase